MAKFCVNYIPHALFENSYNNRSFFVHMLDSMNILEPEDEEHTQEEDSSGSNDDEDSQDEEEEEEEEEEEDQV